MSLGDLISSARRARVCAVLPVALASFIACGDDLVAPAILSASIDPTTVDPGQGTHMTVEVEGVDLHAETGGHALRAAHGDEEGLVPAHIHVYLDDTDRNPLVMTSSLSFHLTIPGDTAAGAHTLIVRLHGEDHKILEPEVKRDVALTVR